MSLDELRAARKRIVVYHGFYGCDTGCCGHYVFVDDEDIGGIDFGHPFASSGATPEERTQAYRDYARDLITERLGADHVADIDWDNCVIFDD